MWNEAEGPGLGEPRGQICFRWRMIPSTVFLGTGILANVIVEIFLLVIGSASTPQLI